MTVRLEERRWDDAEGMVLPWPKRVERWKVGVCMFSWRGVPSYARDVDADNVFCDLNWCKPTFNFRNIYHVFLFPTWSTMLKVLSIDIDQSSEYTGFM